MRCRAPRSLAVLLLAALPLALLALSASPASAAPTSDEQRIFDLANASRRQSGLAALQYDGTASDRVTRPWSNNMAVQNRLYHNPNYVSEIANRVTNQWTRLAENVGYGGTADSVFTAFMNSSGHRANILGAYNRVGIGVVRSGSRVWVTMNFIQGPALSAAASGDPYGSFDAARRVPGGLFVSGWTIDPSSPTASLPIHVYVDGTPSFSTADQSRPDVGAAVPGAGDLHGFGFVVPASPGSHNVCAYAINTGAGANTQLGCKGVHVTAEPFGSLDNVTRSGVSGWTIDPDTSGALDVHVYVDGRFAAGGRASASRGDVGAFFPGYGNGHGFSLGYALTPGGHQVCAYALNGAGTPGGNTALGCRTV